MYAVLPASFATKVSGSWGRRKIALRSAKRVTWGWMGGAPLPHSAKRVVVEEIPCRLARSAGRGGKLGEAKSPMEGIVCCVLFALFISEVAPVHRFSCLDILNVKSMCQVERLFWNHIHSM